MKQSKKKKEKIIRNILSWMLTLSLIANIGVINAYAVYESEDIPYVKELSEEEFVLEEPKKEPIEEEAGEESLEEGKEEPIEEEAGEESLEEGKKEPIEEEAGEESLEESKEEFIEEETAEEETEGNIVAVTIQPKQANAAHNHEGFAADATAITQENWGALENAGHYYLTENITITQMIRITGSNIGNKKEVSLCLNGHSVTADINETSDNKSIFYLEFGRLNLYDCDGNGKLTGGGGYDYDNYNSYKGGAIYLRKSELNMYGGNITDNHANWGGAVFIDGSDNTNSIFNMYGGSIENNSAVNGGGAVEVENSHSRFTIYKGKIANNNVEATHSNLHKGGGVHFADGEVTINGSYGDVIIEDNYVAGSENNLYLRSGRKITITNKDNIVGKSRIGISHADMEGSSEKEGITTGYGTNDKNRKFFLDGIHPENTYAMIHEGDELYIIKLPFEISKQPKDVTINTGKSATYSVEVKIEETYTYTYQWQMNDGNGFTDIEGATKASYTVSNAGKKFDGCEYRCIITRVIGENMAVVISNAATLTVKDMPAPKPTQTPNAKPEPEPDSEVIANPKPIPESVPTTEGVEITIPVSREETDSVVYVKAEIAEETAKVRELTEEELMEVAKNETHSDSIEINLSKVGVEIKEVVLPIESLKEIAKIMEETDNNLEKVTVKLSAATVEISKQTLNAVLSKMNGNDLRLVVDDIHQDTLNDAQKEVVKDVSVHQCIDAYFISNGVRIGEFDGGEVTLRLPFEAPEGKKTEGFCVWYLSEDGVVEKYDTRYIEGELVFVVTHFSDYVVVYDKNVQEEISSEISENVPEPVKDDVPKTGEEAKGNIWLLMTMISSLGILSQRKKKYDK